jgi:hypothetical protein
MAAATTWATQGMKEWRENPSIKECRKLKKENHRNHIVIV